MTTRIRRWVETDTGHRVPNHKSKCRHMHGHRYRWEVELEGELVSEMGVSDEGMLMDFSDVSEILKKHIHDVVDHAFIVYENDTAALNALSLMDDGHRTLIVPFVPTAENLARWAFEQVEPVSEAISERLTNEIHQEILPAAREKQFERFARGVFRFGELAGRCFASVQGGAYHGAELIKRVDWLRSMGIEGVGQSSWGPTLFALFENESAADAFVAYAQQAPMGERLEYQVTSTDNCGASISEALSVEGD